MNKRYFIGAGLCFVLFFAIGILTCLGYTKSLDDYGYQLIRMLDSSFFDTYFVFVTRFGNTAMIIVILIIFLFFNRSREGIVLGGLGCLSLCINTLIKHIVKRERPSVVRLIEQGGYSFPSGHAMISICVYGYLLYLVMRKVKCKILRYFLMVFLIILILSIGISRIYVGVHYVSDVLAGYFLAMAIILLIIVLSNRFYVRGDSHV